jgi:hypothetical protein
MFRIIFGLQAIVYLLLVPLLKEQVFIDYRAPLTIGLCACLPLLAGFLIPIRAPVLEHDYRYVPRPQIALGMIVLGVFYCLFSLQFGLLNRRQGSELMAQVFGSLPLYVLLVVRVYEIILIPMIVLFIYAGPSMSRITKLIFTITVLISIPFMGIDESRGRLLVLGLSILVFMNYHMIFKLLRGSWRLYAAIVGVLGSFYVISQQRAASYGRAADFYIEELLNRLDGMRVVVELRDFRQLDLWGSWDFNIFAPMISKIPFLEAGRELKLIGRTSSKQYLLQDVLGTKALDSANSMVTDPVYLGGLALLVITFYLLARAIRRFDARIERGDLLRSPLLAAAMFAFGLSFVMIENDLFGALTTFVQNYVVSLVLVLIGCKRQDRDVAAAAVSVAPHARKPRPAYSSQL